MMRRAIPHLLRWALAAEIAIVAAHVFAPLQYGTGSDPPAPWPVQSSYAHTHVTNGRTSP